MLILAVVFVIALIITLCINLNLKPSPSRAEDIFTSIVESVVLLIPALAFTIVVGVTLPLSCATTTTEQLIPFDGQNTYIRIIDNKYFYQTETAIESIDYLSLEYDNNTSPYILRTLYNSEGFWATMCYPFNACKLEYTAIIPEGGIK